MPLSAPAPPSEADIRDALRDCYYPALGANIVDLGLVHFIAITHDAKAPGAGIRGVPTRWRVAIELLSANAEGNAEVQLIAQIQNRLTAFETISHSEVKIAFEPAWEWDRIEPKLRERLRLAIGSRQRSHDLVQIQTTPRPSHKAR